MRQLSRALIAAAALSAALAACAPPPAPYRASYRQTDVKLYSRAVFEPARAAGPWHEVAGFYDPAVSGCSVGLSRIARRPGGGLELTLDPCAGLGPRTVAAEPTRAAGQFRPALKGRLGEPWWVLWVDEDYRAMAIGTPSGHFGAILSRGPTLRPDLFEAARQILAFNGYDLAKLRPDMR